MKKLASIFFAMILSASLLCFVAHAAEFRLMTDPLPPFNMKVKSGEVRGITADSLITILNRAGKEATYQDIEVLPWPRAHKIAEQGPKAVLFSVARTPTREKLFKWVGPIHPITIGFIASKKRNISIAEPANLKKYRIGVVRESGPEQLARKKAGLAYEDLTRISTPNQLIEMLKLKRIDLIAHADIPTAYLLSLHGLDPTDYEMVYPMMKLKLYIAFSTDTSDSVIARLQTELDHMKERDSNGSSEFDVLFKRYFTSGVIVHEKGR